MMQVFNHLVYFAGGLLMGYVASMLMHRRLIKLYRDTFAAELDDVRIRLQMLEVRGL